MRTMKLLLVSLLILCMQPALAACDKNCTRILFLGNSYTYTNDLPAMFTKLATAAQREVETAMVVKGGWTLKDVLYAPETMQQLKAKKWNYVVLQEQSQVPASQQHVMELMYPAAKQLANAARANGATPALFLTWARRDGWKENGLADYSSMQKAINEGYMAVGQVLNIPIIPVGYVWNSVLLTYPDIELYKPDGSHPSTAGTYLAACVFYAAIFHASPEGITYTADLPANEAQILQKAAAQGVKM